MTFNKKKRRKIVVGDQTYFWQATGNDHGIDLCVAGETKECQKLFTGFDYKYSPFENVQHDEIYFTHFVVTPYIVRQIIECALSKGWRPFEKGKDFGLSDYKIYLRLDKNMALSEVNFLGEVDSKTKD